MTFRLSKKRSVSFRNNLELFLLVLPLVLFYVLFHYWPMQGVQIAFRHYIPTSGVWGSKWVGLKHFSSFFSTPEAWRLIKNTFMIGFFSMLTFPVPIIIALMLNMLASLKFKKLVQTSIFVPHFVSVIVVVGMLKLFCSLNGGIINNIVSVFGGKPIDFFGSSEWFIPLYILSGIWQSTGWNTVIYTGALTSINPELYESAIMDGANKLQRLYYIDIPGIMPTIIIMFILNIGHTMDVGFEKVYLMQTPFNLSVSEVISTYVYKIGIQSSQYSFSAAVGLFNSLVNFFLLIITNYTSKHFTNESLW